MAVIGERTKTLLLSVLLALATMAVFWPALRNDFVLYDDPQYVTENLSVLRGLSWEGVQWAFTTDYFGNWHPLTWISHLLDVRLFGKDPWGHHLTSVLLHSANAALLFLVLLRLTGGRWASLFAAALFAFHPLRVESVAWVAERKDVLSGLFFFLTLLAYERYARCQTRRKWFFYSLALLAFALGLMSKPMLVTVPCLLLLLDFWPLGRLRLPGGSGDSHKAIATAHLLLEKLPFAAFSVASSLITYSIQNRAGAVGSIEALPLHFRIDNALISYARYLGKTFWPADLAVLYPLPKAWPGEWALAAAVLLAGVSYLVIRQLRRAPFLAVGWFWFVGTLVPVIGLVQVGQQAMADRYMYLPQVGLFLILAFLPTLLPGNHRTRGVSALAGAAPQLSGATPFFNRLTGPFALILLVVCAWLTRVQIGHWQNNVTVFEHALAVTRDNAVAHNNLGTSYLRSGRLDAAEEQFTAALRIRPDYAEALVNAGLCREQRGNSGEAVEFLERGMSAGLTPAASYNLGLLLSKQGRAAEAEARYRAALAAKPDMVDAWYNLGLLLAQTGRTDEAAQCYRRTLELRPDYPSAHLNLGTLYIGQNQIDTAIFHFEAALKADPRNADAHFNLAAALKLKGDFTRSQSEFEELCRLRPADADARLNLAVVVMNQAKLEEALPIFQQVLALRPDPQAHYFIAIIQDAQGQSAEAATHYREAIRLNPQAPVYLNDLAWLLATSGQDNVRNGAEAVRLAEQACQTVGEKEPRFWGTLDAAYAEAGRFDDAIKTATKTRDLAKAAGQPEIAQAAEQRLALYQAGKPFRSPPVSSSSR
jgi:tetratricopeptide (TPR) repeat protein